MTLCKFTCSPRSNGLFQEREKDIKNFFFFKNIFLCDYANEPFFVLVFDIKRGLFKKPESKTGFFILSYYLFHLDYRSSGSSLECGL